MKPEEITYRTELDRLYGQAFKAVQTSSEFESFLKAWDYWLDEVTKKLTGADWERLLPLIADCKTEGVMPEEKHEEAIALLMPAKLIRVSIVAHEVGMPWGCAYIHMKEQGAIDW